MKKVVDEETRIKVGLNIRQLREAKNMTQIELCELEEDLTTKALRNIENGKSFPSFPTFQFLASRLEVNISELIDTEKIELPKRYLKLKYMLIRIPIYNDPEQIKKQENIFREIDEKYFANLPNHEQLAINILKGANQAHLEEELEFSKSILDEHFMKLTPKTYYNVNDLLFIGLYFSYYYHKFYEKDRFEPMSST